MSYFLGVQNIGHVYDAGLICENLLGMRQSLDIDFFLEKWQLKMAYVWK